MSQPYEIDRVKIVAVEALIRPYLRRTPTLEANGRDLGLDPSLQIALKLELHQHSGSFKARGAFANLLSRRIPAAGVVAVSGGNHGAAVAYAAMMRDVPAKIFVPAIATPAKIARIRACGADLVVGGSNIAEAFAASAAWSATSDAAFIHPFEQYETVLGQATLALELETQAPALETLLVPVGGGGLIAGIAAWYERRIRIVGVEPEASPTLTRALAAGRPVDAEMGGLAADSLSPPRVGEQVFAIAQRLVDTTVLVTDAQIGAAQLLLWECFRIAAEPGGAAAFAALASGRYAARPGERIGIVLTGANTDAVRFTA